MLRLLNCLGVKLKAVLSTQKEILNRLERLEKKFGGGYVDAVNEDQLNDISGLFPLMSLREVKYLEKQLNQEKERCRVIVDHLKTIGGRDVKSVIYRMMPYMLGYEVAQLYSWTGGKGKMIFCDLQLCKIILDVVRKQFNATDHKISEVIKKWLAKS